MKIIIWGYPLYKHSLSFINNGFFRAAKYLNYETYWFDDSNYPKDFDYTGCIFITQWYACNNIPLNKDSIYFVHDIHENNKGKFLDYNFYDLRYLEREHHDAAYSYTLPNNLRKLETGVFIDDPKKHIYMAWATNLLPNEIDLNSVYIKRNPIWYFTGNWNDGRANGCDPEHANAPLARKFAELLKQDGVDFYRHEHWISEEEQLGVIKKSYCWPDFRGPTQQQWGYVPCRVFKAISGGHLGISNTDAFAAIDNFLDEYYVYSTDIIEMYELFKKYNNDEQFKINQMKLVKDRNTFVNRLKGLLSVL